MHPFITNVESGGHSCGQCFGTESKLNGLNFFLQTRMMNRKCYVLGRNFM